MSTLTDMVFKAGIIGCGGAGFPTHVKLAGKAGQLIINGAECEPMLRTDRYLMIHHAEDIVRAASEVRKALGGIPCTIVLKKSYEQEAAALETAIAAADPEIRLKKMQSFYPAGDEQVIVAEVTGKVVPPAGIPLDVGCIVDNAATMKCIADALDGKPFTHKFLTVSGLVRKPTVMCVPIGTSFADCIAQAGGASEQDTIVINGGPMMGRRLTAGQAEKACVTKTTSGILLLPGDGPIAYSEKVSIEHMKNRARSACIQCSFCTELCPRHLLGHPLEPHKIMRKLGMCTETEDLLQDPDIQRAALCCECGICEMIACPMGLQPRRVNAMFKRELAKAGIRYPKGTESEGISPEREGRKIPTQRAAQRAGVMDMMNACGTDALVSYEPKSTELSLHQGAGAPSQPIVRSGDRVKCGDLIAVCPEGKLGSNLHAGMDGTVTVGEESIRITEEA